MNTESKGRAWYGKIYRKLETILVEVDNLASQAKVSLDSVRNEPEKLTEDHCLRTEHSDCNQKETTSLCRNGAISSQASQSTHHSHELACNNDTEFQAALANDKVANIRSFSSNSMIVNQDEFFMEDFDEAPLDTIDLYDMTFREEPSDFDDSLLYAARDRTRELRSFKRKVMDAITSRRRREKEYEQLAIWFGDADMGCDVINTKNRVTTSPAPKSSEPSEDSEWELL